MLDAPSIFLSTPSARRATLNACCFFSGVRPISIHALREEGDDGVIAGQLAPVISIHALREEGDIWGAGNPTPHMISIHALREEGDDVQSYDRSTELISIHALREEGDFWMLSYCCCKTISIHALREEGDHPAGILPDSRADFYPRPPRGGRQRDVLGTFATPGISIHALREEGDPMLANLGEQAVLFLSTPSARRATSRPFPSPVPSIYFYPRPPRGGRLRQAFQVQKYYEISIHALREEGD